MNDKKSKGDFGEETACKYIKKNGYKILGKNFRTKFGEIDLIGIDNDTICFIEVKARSSSDYGSPEQFVTKRKQERLWKTASIYINKNTLEFGNYRFDVISVDLENEEIEIFKNAFQPKYSF
ncbi:MAG: YraN family protein [Deltaproteobacteria bacterium]|nr:YraN family protein [Candidatus Dadabacteria bacterium]TDJ04106.1 MAG: YraN family protein [Deltaproteobacteria bacterium]